MQVNNILNIATSASGSAASPHAGSGSGGAKSEGGSSFNEAVASEAPRSDVSNVESNDLQINDPQGGIIPIPQIYDTANIIPQLPAEQYIDLANGGIVDQSVLQNIFGASEAQILPSAGIPGLVPVDAPQLTGAQLLRAQPDFTQVPTASIVPVIPAASAPVVDPELQQGVVLANELANSGLQDDAAFDAELTALQNSLAKGADPKNLEEAFNQIVSAAGKNPADATKSDLAKVQEMMDKYFSDKLGGAEAEEEGANKKVVAQGEAEVMKIANATTASTNLVSTLNAKISNDVSAFDSKPIDANEFALGTKMNEFNTSKLEAQIKVVEAEQIMRSPVEQIKVKVAQGLELGMDKISIKLHPAELGKVDVEMNLDRDGKAHVRIVADRSETLEFLRRDSSDLQKSLRDVGVDADSNNLQFSLNQNNEGKGREFGENSQNSSTSAELAAEEYSVNIPQTNDEIYMAVTEGGLDLMV